MDGVLGAEGAKGAQRSMNVGIIGAAADKFTVAGEQAARILARHFLSDPHARLVSGGCHLGGIDAWAEEIADELGRQKIIHRPQTHAWSTGYKPRNLLIARDSDVVHVVVVRWYPPEYAGMRFSLCYHCARRAREHGGNVPAFPHVKSGGCWTARQAELLGKPVYWHAVTV